MLFDSGIRDVQRRLDRLIQLFPDVLPYEFRTTLVRALPLALSDPLAQKLRSKSSRAIQQKSPSEMGIVDQAVLDCFARGADAIICGHVHTPRVQSYDTPRGKKTLFVLSDFREGGKYLFWDGKSFHMETLNIHVH